MAAVELPDALTSDLSSELKKDYDFLHNTVIEDNDLFNRIRDSIKKNGDMFLLGKPSEKILQLILKLYHENIIRILLSQPQKIKMMLGIMELNDGAIYITISEDPREDTNYVKKTQLLYSLLNQINVTILFPERDLTDITDISMREIAGVLTSDLFPTTFTNWRNPIPDGKNGVITWNNLKTLNSPNPIMFIDDIPKEKQSGTTKYNYDYELIWRPKIEVNLIHSIKYLNERKTGVSFMPFKKIKKDDTNGITYECNNGSTCSESKLFSYLFTNLTNKTFDDIKGYAAYWISDTLPPNHIITNYSFSNSIPEENERLEKLVGNILGLLDKPGSLIRKLSDKYPPQNFQPVFKSVVQPFALPCPGCFANYIAYKTNNKQHWDNSQCLPYVLRTRWKHGGRRWRSKKSAKRKAYKIFNKKTKGKKNTRKCSTCKKTKKYINKKNY